MHTVARSALVTHSAEDLYSLVNDIESYPAFFPRCGESEVHEHSGREMVARLHIAFRGVHKSFTTRNRLAPFESIRMTLLDGPFSTLSGTWEFKALRRDACRISLDLRFDFANALVGGVIGPVFAPIADSLVESFVARARQLHGLPAGDSPQPDVIHVEVVYALPEQQVVEPLTFARSDTPVTIARAIRASSIPRRFPRLNLAETPVGVFGVERPLDWSLADYDRVEIYRPLRMSPAEARRRRARMRME